MYLKNLYSNLCVLLVFGAPLWAQSDSVRQQRYTPDFKFVEGVYLNFDQLRNNDPLPKSRIITTIDYSDPEFFDRVLQQEKIFYYNQLGTREEFKTQSLWGYSRNGFVYINMKEGFFRITLIGSICHFVANHTTYSSSYSPYAMGVYSNPYYMGAQAVPSTEVRQYLFDFEDGRVLDYNDESLAILLMKDPPLHDEYVALSRKKRKQLRYLYLRKFNDKYPVYFPIH